MWWVFNISKKIPKFSNIIHWLNLKITILILILTILSELIYKYGNEYSFQHTINWKWKYLHFKKYINCIASKVQYRLLNCIFSLYSVYLEPYLSKSLHFICNTPRAETGGQSSSKYKTQSHRQFQKCRLD